MATATPLQRPPSPPPSKRPTTSTQPRKAACLLARRQVQSAGKVRSKHKVSAKEVSNLRNRHALPRLDNSRPGSCLVQQGQPKQRTGLDSFFKQQNQASTGSKLSTFNLSQTSKPLPALSRVKRPARDMQPTWICSQDPALHSDSSKRQHPNAASVVSVVSHSAQNVPIVHSPTTALPHSFEAGDRPLYQLSQMWVGNQNEAKRARQQSFKNKVLQQLKQLKAEAIQQARSRPDPREQRLQKLRELQQEVTRMQHPLPVSIFSELKDEV
jgi:hypothetical protein